MINSYVNITSTPTGCRKLVCKDSLLTLFNCKQDGRYQDIWSHHNYILYVLEGRKVWHTAHHSYDLREGTCVFVKKGGAIVEQFFDTDFCFFLFFIPDEFICDVLNKRSKPVPKVTGETEAIIRIESSATIMTYFQSMYPYFIDGNEPDPSLLELKFRELILAIADQRNEALHSYFRELMNEPQIVSVQRVMEQNFCFNLRLEEFAKLSSRSLSAFKRDFEKLYGVSPGKWLMEKRLNHSHHLLANMGRTVAEAASESGFESYSHFSRSFRTRFGHPPTAMKQLAIINVTASVA